MPMVGQFSMLIDKSLSAAELNKIQKRFIEGYGLTYEFEDLSSQMDAEERNGAKRKDNPFLMSAFRDKGTAADCLEGSVDTNGSVFHSQQLAEKMLKAVMFAAGLSEDDIRRKYNHRINDIFKDVSSHNVAPSTVDSAVKLISQYKMDIRYSVGHLPQNESVEAFWSGLRVGGWCATILSGHDRRV
jgi:HEPN domain-containing protein